MNTNTRSVFAAIAMMSAALLVGCSKDGGFFPGMVNHNEGPVDYRVVPIEENKEGELARSPEGLADERYLKLGSEFLKPYEAEKDAPKLRTFSVRKKEGENPEPVETIRITLKQAFVRDFPEFGPVGELAVIVNVKETDAGLSTEDIKSGRVVYYTEGARKNSFLNMRDQSVYGPITYKGGDIQIRVSMLELDSKDNNVAKSMLKVIASLGSMVYAPASPVLAALEKIGGSLINLNGDDLEWDYAMRLSRRLKAQKGATRSGVFDAWVRDGYYVMIRSDPSVERVSRFSKSHDRERFRQPPDWDRLAIDQRTGELLTLNDQGTVTGLYLENSYLVFAVQSGFDPASLEIQDNIATLDKLTQALNTRSDLFKTSVDEISQTVKGLLDQRKTNREREDNATGSN